MSSILIKGMEMPKNCAECRLWDTCEYMNDFDDWASILDAVEDGNLVRDKNCPLIEIKTPHGRLIDADELANKTFYNPISAPYITYKTFCNAPTVIEAEGEKDGR
jgi:hypothetical protein